MDEISNIEYLGLIIISILCGAGIRMSLHYAKQRWATTYHHTMSYILLPPITMVITTLIAGNIALSLGMIGALSIVRFRNPVKSPFELVIFFALLTLGIVSTVTLKLSFVLLALILSVILGIKIFDNIAKKFGGSLFQFSFGDGNNPYLLEITTSEIMENLQKEKSMVYFYHDKKNQSITYRFVFKTKEDLIKLQDSVKNNKSIMNIRAEMQP